MTILKSKLGLILAITYFVFSIFIIIIINTLRTPTSEVLRILPILPEMLLERILEIVGIYLDAWYIPSILLNTAIAYLIGKKAETMYSNLNNNDQ